MAKQPIDIPRALDITMTNKDKRFLVGVSALSEDYMKPGYLLFTPKALYRGQSLVADGVPVPPPTVPAVSNAHMDNGKDMDASHCRTNSTASSSSSISSASGSTVSTVHHHHHHHHPHARPAPQAANGEPMSLPPHLRRAMS